MIEYILLVALISIIAIVAIRTVGKKIGDPREGTFAKIAIEIKAGSGTIID